MFCALRVELRFAVSTSEVLTQVQANAWLNDTSQGFQRCFVPLRLGLGGFAGFLSGYVKQRPAVLADHSP